MTEINKKQYTVDVKVMNYLLQAMPNDIYNSVDACKNAKEIWERIKRLMYGSDVANHIRHSRLIDEFDKFTTKEGELLESVYERLTTLVNIMDHNNVCPILVSINTNFLNFLQPERLSRGVTRGFSRREAYNFNDVISSSNHQKFSTPTNDRLRTSSNTRNKAVNQDGRVDIQTRNAGRQNRNQAFNVGNENEKSNQVVQRVPRTESNLGKANGQCYNCNEKGHYTCDGQKPRVSDVKYFREQMLLAMKDEAESNLNAKENDFSNLNTEENYFMLDNCFGDEILEELTVAIIMMAQIQQADDNAVTKPTYDAKAVSKVNASHKAHKQVNHVKRKTIIHASDDDQIDSSIIFDDPYVENNGGTFEHDSNDHDEYHNIQILAYNVQKDVKEKKRLKTISFKENKELEREMHADKDTIERILKEKDKIESDFFKIEKEKIIIQHETQLAKKAFKEQENQYLEDIVDLKEKLSSHDRIVYKMSQSIQTIYMLGKTPNKVYDPFLKAGLARSFMTISELKNKLKTFEKGKGVNTKFDKSATSGKLLCVTPLPNNIAVQARKVSNPEDKIDRSKPATLHSTQKKEQSQKQNVNDIARGMYRITKTETHMPVSKANMNVSNSTGVESSNSVSRPKSKDTKSKNRVLKNTNIKSSSAHVQKVSSSVSIDSNKCEIMNSTICQSNASVLNTKTVNAVNDGSNIVCVSCGKDVFMLSYEKCVAHYALSKDSKVIQLVLWIVDSGCPKHMNGNLKLLRNFVEKFMRTVRFGNDHFATITGYGDYVQGNLTICHVYYVKGLGHNLLSVGQFCDGDLEVTFRSNTFYVWNLEGDDLLTGSREFNLYTISISELAASSLVCLMSKDTSTKSWLWHRRLSHLNFDTINQLTSKDLVDGLPKIKYHKDHLCSACEQGKSKKSSFPSKLVPSTKSKLKLLHMDLCRPMRVESINGKEYILVIVNDYSRYTWVYFLRTKDEAPDMIINFISQVQRNLKAQILKILIDNGTEFKNEKLRSLYAKLGIVHHTSIARTPQQNGVVE
ncbi:retrovirus-related pol polyprotein from transposon TNT 1-94 [Tanacetum coccineum]